MLAIPLAIRLNRSDAEHSEPQRSTPFLSHPRGIVNGMTSLTDTEREMLEMERGWWAFAGAKEAEIRRRFDMSATRYYQTVNALLDREDALAFDPLLVKRLRRLRQQRQLSRPSRRLG